MLVRRLDELPAAELEPLLAESRAEGHNFMDRLVDDYADGSNRFDQPGEAMRVEDSQSCRLQLTEAGTQWSK